jgi:DNA mismatch repair protein MutS
MAHSGKTVTSRHDAPSVSGQAHDGKSAPTALEKSLAVTPSMAQFLELKAANPDCILWYRMGDFYELFFEDAVVAAQALGIVLTKRGKHLGQDIPMCGVPVHRADEYLQRLIRRGFRVAVCEQLEDPAEAKRRGSKAVVRRDVVRLVTPGTLTEDSLLDSTARNFLTALFKAPNGNPHCNRAIALASLDISTGEFEVGETGANDLPGELVRLSPSEVIAGEGVFADETLKKWVKIAGAAATPVPGASFDSFAGERLLKAQLGVADLAAFGSFTRAELAAVGALLKYVELTQIGKKPVVRPPRRSSCAAVLVIDAASRASLELVRSSSGEKQGSLLHAIDRTVTGPGARELAARLASPLRDRKAILARLDAAAYLFDDELLRIELRRTLKSTPDIARALSRLAFQRGGPRDLAAVRDGLAAAAACAQQLQDKSSIIGLPQELDTLVQRLLGTAPELRTHLIAALIDEPPHLKRDGGFVREHYREDLDAARHLREDSRKVMAELETKYLEQTGIKSLKVRHNNILGFYIEVTAGTAKPLLEPPLSASFRHRQTMANAMRFTTDELITVEDRIATAGERALAIEQEVFAELLDLIVREERQLTDLAGALAELDCVAGLAELAAEEGYVRPQLEDGIAFEIHGGRHPVVEQALKVANAGPFIENDCILARAEPAGSVASEADCAARLWLVTGPNMAGKSTFLRQNALITVLAQLGSYVPAREARIGIVDRLFSRVGAADDLARGRSTFMVEMVETAAILTQATERSLVILDEIGRGTATFDGLSIAWATVEYLNQVNKCRALFATHYHELTALAGRLSEVTNVTVDVKEWRDEIVFLHKVRPGAADRSYGIQVAKLAGLPNAVVQRASEVLRLLEKSNGKPGRSESLCDELPLFAAARSLSETPKRRPSLVEAELAAINPDELTPKAALEVVYRLIETARKEAS